MYFSSSSGHLLLGVVLAGVVTAFIGWLYYRATR
jgi:hypothetical protein